MILLDLTLKYHQDGLEVCWALRSNIDPALAKVPLVILTGATTETDIKAALAAGADSYMSKPYNPNVLLDLISHMIETKSRVVRKATHVANTQTIILNSAYISKKE